MWLKNTANLINQLSKSEYTKWLTNTSSLNSDVTYTKFDKLSASLMDTEALFRIIVMQEIAPHINWLSLLSPTPHSFKNQQKLWKNKSGYI